MDDNASHSQGRPLQAGPNAVAVDPSIKVGAWKCGTRPLSYVFFVALLLSPVIAWWLYFSGSGHGALQATMIGHKGEINFIAFAPDGNTLATAGQDRTVRLWDRGTGKELATLTDPAEVVGIAYLPDGKLLATAGLDGSVRLWEAGTGQQRAPAGGAASGDKPGTPLAVHAAAFSLDGRLLASVGVDERVTVRRMTDHHHRTLPQEPEKVSSLALSPDGKRLAAKREDGSITIWDLARGEQIRHFEERSVPNGISCLLFSPDGKTLATNGVSSGTVRTWDLSTGEEKPTGRAEVDWPVRSMAFSADGTIIAATTLFRARMVFWDASSGQVRGTIAFPGKTSALAASPDGKTLASGHRDGSVRLWDWTQLLQNQ